MNNVDSLFFRGIYQVGVPITRSFRSVVPPGKMRPEIAMHLCALVEDEDQREGLLPLRPLPWPFPGLRFALPFGTLLSPPLPRHCLSFYRRFPPSPPPSCRIHLEAPAPRVYRRGRPYHS